MEPAARQRDAERSRTAILDAAERLFARDGFASVTLAQIGSAAGVSRGTPGYFFGSKEALYGIVLERATGELRGFADRLPRLEPGGRPDGRRIAAVVDSLLSLLASRPAVIRLVDREPGADAHAAAVGSALHEDPRSLAVLALTWFPLAHPEAARRLGVDVDDPAAVRMWRDRALTYLGAGADVAALALAPALAAASSADPSSAKPKKRKKKKREKNGRHGGAEVAPSPEAPETAR